MTVTLSVVVPLYNEEQVVRETHRRLKAVMDAVGEPYEIVFVDDGSRDQTPAIARELCRRDACTKLVSFSRNFGHQAAITAGMEHAAGRAVVVIDADLQDPPEVIPRMIQKWREGYEVVYGRRMARREETLFKKATAALFYRLLSALADVHVPLATGDFRLLDRKALDALQRLPEHNRYVRGLTAWIGFRQTGVPYVREGRLAGETKYPLRKMIRLALDGITAMSYKPLKLATWAGAVFLLAGGGLLLGTAGELLTGRSPGPWLPLAGLGALGDGITLVALGVMGEYIARIADEAKARPSYIIREKVGFHRGRTTGGQKSLFVPGCRIPAAVAVRRGGPGQHRA